MLDLHYLLNTYNDIESFIYEEELKLFNQGLVIKIPFNQYQHNNFYNETFQLSEQYYQLNTNPLGVKEFLRKNHELKFHMFIEDIFLMEGYVGKKKLFEKKLILFSLDDFKIPDLSLQDKLLWWKNDTLSLKITLIKRSEVRFLTEGRECIFNSDQYLEKVFRTSHYEFNSLKKNNLNLFNRIVDKRVGSLVDYSKSSQENVSLIQTMNIVEIRNVWSNLWNNSVFLDNIESNEYFLEKCSSNCKPLINLLILQYEYVKNFNQVEVKKEGVLNKSISLFRCLLDF